MEEFREVMLRRHRVLPLTPESIDFWGGPTDARLGSVGAIEVAAKLRGEQVQNAAAVA